MKINLHNYEAFFLDYKEGNLPQEQEKELFLFLEEHPHLYEELHGFENVRLEDLGVVENFVNKNAIKKTEYSKETLIAYTEGLLEEKSKKEIDLLAVQNSALKKELAFYQAAKVQPDLNEKFKNKTKLKRGGVIIALQNNYTFLRVAAAVLLLIGLFFLVNKFNTKEEVNNKVEVAAVGKAAVGNQEKRDQRNKNQETMNKNLASVNNENTVKQQNIKRETPDNYNLKQETRNNNNPKPEIQNVASNTVQTNNPIANNIIKNNPKDSVSEKIFIAENKVKEESPVIDKSYFNYSADKDDEDETPVMASANTGKKSFFQKIVKVAKKVNGLGLKNVVATEQNNSNAVSIGSFVVAETKSY